MSSLLAHTNVAWNKLPHISGTRLSSIEEESLVRSSVAFLVDLAEFELSSVVKELLVSLAILNKVRRETSSSLPTF